MPHIFYNGIELTPISDYRTEFQTVMDSSQTDYLFAVAHVSGVFAVNGQTGIRVLDYPPVSLLPDGGVQARTAAAGAVLPPGAVVAPPAATEVAGGPRQSGALNDTATLVAAPYAAGVASPSYAVDSQPVRRATVAPSRSAVTFGVLMERLTQPRGQLFVTEEAGAGSDIIIQSPPTGEFCDSKGGPKPKVLGLTHCQGDGVTYFVQWECEAYLRLWRRADPNDFILSNRWVMTHHCSDGGFTDIEVEGDAVFDLGLLHRGRFDADTFRPYLFLPIPRGFERRDIEVTESADGSILHYHFIDHQREISFPASVYVDAVDIQTDHQQSVLCDEDVLGGTIALMDSMLNRRWVLDSIRDTKKTRRTRKKKPAASGITPPTP
jgi:hypothetical protein